MAPGPRVQRSRHRSLRESTWPPRRQFRKTSWQLQPAPMLFSDDSAVSYTLSVSDAVLVHEEARRESRVANG